MSEDLARFVADRYDEAETATRATEHNDGPHTLEWRRGGARHLTFDNRCSEDYESVFAGDWDRILIARGTVGGGRLATHIAATDPAHRLADIKLKRAILAEHEHEAASTPDHRKGPDSFGCVTCDHIADEGTYGGGWCATVRQLGTEFAEHPAYKEGWKP